MAEIEVKDLSRRMDGAIEALKREFAGLRTGRASASLLEPIHVNAYGSDRGLASAVDKAIRDSGLGLNPRTEGQLVRVPIPELSQERRQELTKIAHKYAEQARVAVRNVRRDGMDMLKRKEKAHEISEDEHHGWTEKVQQMTDQHIKKIDELLAQKEKEILQV